VFSENEIFGGIPDGEPFENGEINYSSLPMLEMKTTSIDKLMYLPPDANGVMKIKFEDGLPVVKAKGLKKAE
jgi:hypothetical protein